MNKEIMKLEVGMYVRTKKYGIAKIIGGISGKFNIDVLKKDGCTLRCQKEKDILKASFNIIDILEVGDYVNGQKIVDIGCLTNGPRKGTKVIDYYITPNAVSYLENGYIKSVITHEQMEQMAYKVGEIE